jgi:plastocyanin
MSAARKRLLVLVLLGILVCLPLGAAFGATHNVNQTGFTFVPANITIQVGDTVMWTHSAGSHTVTNGTGAADVNAGVLFDAPLTAANPTFQYVFNTPGTVPYFCRPHEGLGMKGTITVVEPVPSLTLPGLIGLALITLGAGAVLLRRRAARRTH